MIRGSAVAVAPDTLLASCRAVGGREQVGVVRRGDYRLARVSRPRGGQDVCALRAPGARLEAARGFRGLDDLRECEAVYAVVSRAGAEYAVADGQLAAKGGAGGGGFLETTVALPSEVLSAALFDAAGNLVGLGSGGPVEGSLVLAAPLSAALAPRLARLDLGPRGDVAPGVQVASLPVRAPTRRLLVFRDDQDRDGDDGPALASLAGVEPVRGPTAPGGRDPTDTDTDGTDPGSPNSGGVGTGADGPDGGSGSSGSSGGGSAGSGAGGAMGGTGTDDDGGDGGPDRGAGAADRATGAGEQAAGALGRAREQAAGALGRAREQAAGALGRAREQAAGALDRAREQAAGARDRAAAGRFR
jgi:hypothetical protein